MSGEVLTLPTSSGAVTLTSLADGKTSGDVITWNGTAWVSGKLPLIGLADGTMASDVLTWNGTAWVSSIAAAGGISPYFLSGSGEFLLDETRWLYPANDESVNTLLGLSALASYTTGNSNTAVGNAALRYTTDGSYNTAVGREALYNNTSGSDNTAVGFQAFYNNTSGSGNTMIGKSADCVPSTDGSIVIGANGVATSSHQLVIKSQVAGEILGSVTLVGGSATVASVSIAADTYVFLSIKTPGGTVGHHYVSSVVPGVSFNITSSSGADTSTINYFMVRNG